MKRSILAVSAAVLAAGIFGCIPKRVAWSPDGKRAAVAGEHGLYLCDGDGNLSERLIDGLDKGCLTPVVWLADSRRLLVVRTRHEKRWDEVAKLLTDEKRTKLEACAEQVRAELQQHEDPWESFESRVLRGLTPGERQAIRVCLRKRLGDDPAAQTGKAWEAAKDAEAEVSFIQLLDAAPSGVKPGEILAESIDGIFVQVLSGDDRNVAYVTAVATSGDKIECPRDLFAQDQQREHGLFVVPTDPGSPPRLVARHVAWYPDWSADGQHLAYVQSSHGFDPDEEDSRIELGTVARKKVASEDGALLEAFGIQEDLAGVLFTQGLKVCCLRDGRIVFSAADVHLPSTPEDVPEGMSLFAVAPRQQATVTRLVPRKAERSLPEQSFGFGMFEFSPDQTRVVMAEARGTVAVFELAGGGVTVVNSCDKVSDREAISTLPTWRSDEELCFEVPAGSSLAAEGHEGIVLWSPKGTRSISKTWADKDK